jgi:hypothetical protein
MADGLQPAATARAVVTTLIAAAIATAVAARVATSIASGCGTASSLGTAALAPEGKSLSERQTRAEDRQSDQSKEISIHGYRLLFKALDV